MLVKRKCVVQKSFRIDEKIENDLNLLSELTNRSQNELVNVAVMELLQDNKDAFLEVAVLEHFKEQMNLGFCEFEPFEMGGLKVEVRYIDGDKVEVRAINSVEDYTRKFDSDISEEFESYLRKLYIYIDREAEDTKEYLNRRVDYRDYVKVRK